MKAACAASERRKNLYPFRRDIINTVAYVELTTGKFPVQPILDGAESWRELILRPTRTFQTPSLSPQCSDENLPNPIHLWPCPIRLKESLFEPNAISKV